MGMDPKALKPRVNYSRAVCRLFLIFKIIVIASFCSVIIFYYTKIADQPTIMDADLVTKNISFSSAERLARENPFSNLENMKRVTLTEEFERNPDCPLENFYAIREWIQNEPHLPKLSDERLFQFLFACFYNLQKTKECIQVYLQLKSTCQEFFCDRDISNPDLPEVLSNNTIFTSPVLTPGDDYRITFLRIDSTDSAHFDFNKTVKLFFMAYDAELYVNGTARGHISIFDLKNCGLRHMTKTTLDAWKKLIRLTQGGMPVRRKTLHVLNTNFFAYRTFQILKPFINPVTFESIHLHRPNELEDLYKYVPKECLPSDYGGFLDSADVLKSRFSMTHPLVNYARVNHDNTARRCNDETWEKNNLKRIYGNYEMFSFKMITK